MSTAPTKTMAMTTAASPGLRDPSPFRSRAVTGAVNGKYVKTCTMIACGLGKDQGNCVERYEDQRNDDGHEVSGYLGCWHNGTDGHQRGGEHSEPSDEDEQTGDHGTGFEDKGRQIEVRDVDLFAEKQVADDGRGGRDQYLQKPDREKCQDFS